MTFLRTLRGLLMGLLRELSDETAYQRHLDRTGSLPSGMEWKRFSDRKHRAKYSQAKCC